MDVYIFGAGASRGYEKSPTGQKMPLAKDFFKTFNKLSISSNPWVLVGYVINYVQENYSINPMEFIDFNVDIETLHTEINNKFHEAIKNRDFLKTTFYSAANIQLAFMFVSTINEIQNGPTSDMHKKFVSTLNQDDSIITFNWDTLIDRALFETNLWFTDSGYSIMPKQIFRNKWVFPENKKSKHELIKLHGSTNWITSYPIWNNDKLVFTHRSGNSDVFIYESTRDKYPCYDGRYMGNYQPFSYGYYPPNLFVEALEAEDGHIITSTILRTGFNNQGPAPSDGITSMPLIITPVREKDYGRFGNLFNNLWDNAKNKVISANRIFIIGYSFPITDVKSNDLFINAFTERRNIPEIIVINPFPEDIVHKFEFEYGIPNNKIFIDKCYISENYDFKKW
jgi:hypothetical protein